MCAMRGLHLLFPLTIISTCVDPRAGLFIKSVTLSAKPAPEVERGTALMLTCDAKVSHASGVSPKFMYNFYKDYKPIHVVPSNTSELATYSIAKARASHSGTYKCEVIVDDLPEESNALEIAVKGLQTPELTVDRFKVTEGSTVSVKCSAQEEQGSLTFYIHNGTKELYQENTSTGEVQKTLTLKKGGTASLSCFYVVHLRNSLSSNTSNVVSVTVHELNIAPTITIKPSTEVIEGDDVNITCAVDEKYGDSPSLMLQLSKGSKTLNPDMKNSTYTAVVRAEDSGEYECNAAMNNVPKTDSATLTVKELFSKPVLFITPADVFEKQQVAITCRSSGYASERIQQEDLKYSIYRNNEEVNPGSTDATYRVTAGTESNGDYRCAAEAKGIEKWSQTKRFTAKVLVSRPTITVKGQVVLNQPFEIKCHSHYGSFPITYTLKSNQRTLNYSKVSSSSDKAVFSAVISSEDQIHDFSCEAQNNGLDSIQKSQPLSAPVIVPVEKPFLTVVPESDDITENQDVYLICTTGRGSPPISFNWYRNGSDSPLHTATVMANSSFHILQSVSGDHSGNYYCKAQNKASFQAVSNHVTFTVKFAKWKTGLIVGACLLCLVGLILFFVKRFRAMRVGVASNKGAGIWTERPPVSDSSDAGDIDGPEEPNVEYTEVLHPQTTDPTRVPTRKGTDTEYSELQTLPPGTGEEC